MDGLWITWERSAGCVLRPEGRYTVWEVFGNGRIVAYATLFGPAILAVYLPYWQFMHYYAVLYLLWHTVCRRSTWNRPAPVTHLALSTCTPHIVPTNIPPPQLVPANLHAAFMCPCYRSGSVSPSAPQLVHTNLVFANLCILT